MTTVTEDTPFALEDDTYDIDFFAPARKDWLEGTDSYLGH